MDANTLKTPAKKPGYPLVINALASGVSIAFRSDHRVAAFGECGNIQIMIDIDAAYGYNSLFPLHMGNIYGAPVVKPAPGKK